MKIDFNRKYNTIAFYTIVVIAIAAAIVLMIANIPALAAICSKIIKLLMPFLLAFGFAYILSPILEASERLLRKLSKDRLSRKAVRMLSVAVTYLTAILILVVFFSIVIPQLAASIASLGPILTDWALTAEKWINGLIQEYQSVYLGEGELFPMLLEKISASLEDFITALSSSASGALTAIAQGVASVTTGLYNFILAVIISVYILASKETFFAQGRKILSAVLPLSAVNKLRDILSKSNTIFIGFIGGKLLDSAIIGVLCFLIMSVFRWPYAVLISVIVGVTNVIPYFGAIIGGAISFLILLIVDPWTALWFAIMVFILQQIDGNIIGPKILGDSTGLSPFWVIFSITVFGSFWGVFGMFIGVPLFAVIHYLISELSAYLLSKKNLPVDTASYGNEDYNAFREEALLAIEKKKSSKSRSRGKNK